MTETVRPTKKQREILVFIEQFIAEHGYSPSYREIMTGLDYTSVATVSLHVNSLIRRGHLRKRDHSARSLEVVVPTGAAPAATTQVAGPATAAAGTPTETAAQKWITDKIEQMLQTLEQAEEIVAQSVRDVETVLTALHVLGMEPVAASIEPRLEQQRQRLQQSAEGKTEESDVT